MKHFLLYLLILLTGCATTKPSEKEEVLDHTILVGDVPLSYYRKPIDDAVPAGTYAPGQSVHIVGKRGKWYKAKMYADGKIVYFLQEQPNSASETNTSPSYDSGTRTIQTGPRGGKYYINSNGNKTYIRRK